MGSGNSYQFCPVNQWTNEHVLEWLRAVCHENSIDSGNLVGFAECTGPQLCSMSQSHFLEVHPLHGTLFYRKFREYLEHRQRPDRHHHRLHHHHHHHHHHLQTTPTNPYIIQNPATGTTYHELLTTPRPPSHPGSYTPWQDSTYVPSPYPGDPPGSYPVDGTLPTPTGEYVGHPAHPTHHHPGMYQPAYHLPYECTGTSTPSPPSASLPVPHPGYLAGPMPTAASPTPHSPSSVSPLPGQQADTRRDRGPKLWEFLLDLLEDPACNPAIIRWENQEERTFRLTSPHDVSLRWGQRRPNQNSLPYDYFARALRYHYKTGMLVSVPERKLVYKFGSLVFQQRRRGPSTPLMYHNPDSPHADIPSGHPT